MRLHGRALPEWFGLTLAEISGLLQTGSPDELPPALLAGLAAAAAAGLDYLVFNQPGFTLSGGEAQRLKDRARINVGFKACAAGTGFETSNETQK